MLLLSGCSSTGLDTGPATTAVATTAADGPKVTSEVISVVTTAGLPDMSLDPDAELILYPIPEETQARDIAKLRLAEYGGPLEGDIEIQVIGQLTPDTTSPRVYGVTGNFPVSAEAPSSEPRGIEYAGQPGECLVFFDGRATMRGTFCGDIEHGGISMGVGGGSGLAVFDGRAPEGASVVVFRVGSKAAWQRTRDGYFYAVVELMPGEQPGFYEYVAYDDSGREVERRGGPDEPLADPAMFVLPTVYSADMRAFLMGLPTTSCSGEDVTHWVLNRSDLPQLVGETTFNITQRAGECDFEALEAMAGDEFTASFGGDDPSELWAQQEENGEEPMYWLSSVLDTPHDTIETEDGTLYVWPAAAAHDGEWDTMPEEHIEALRTIYSEADIQAFADFGSYIGYRVGITETGDWSFFVAGD